VNYLEIARQVVARQEAEKAACLPFTSDQVTRERAVLGLSGPFAVPMPTTLKHNALAVGYWRYWCLPESEPVAAFIALAEDITRLERQTAPRVAWQILREAATNFHNFAGVCPFCRISGPLHLMAEQPELELRDGR